MKRIWCMLFHGKYRFFYGPYPVLRPEDCACIYCEKCEAWSRP